MKSLFAASLLSLMSLAASSYGQASISLTTFGTSVEPDLLTYDGVTSTITGTEVSGGILFPSSFTPVNLTLLDNYNNNPANLRLNLTGLRQNPTSGNFGITLEGSVGKYVTTLFDWASFTTSSTTVTAAINPSLADPGFAWNNIVGWTWDSGGSGGTINATFTSLTVTAVPEPSTYALLALSGLALGGYAIRGRRRA
jgi:hypothetical protein